MMGMVWALAVDNSARAIQLGSSQSGFGSAEYRTRPHDGFCAADGPEHELAHDDYCDYGDVRHGCRDHQR